MKITWLGHAAFLLETDRIRLLTDPYDPTESRIQYQAITIPIDVVTVSHDHFDHNHVSGLEGTFVTVSRAGVFRFENVTVSGFETFHDPIGGAERGPNLVFVVEGERLRICHAGDLGHPLSKEQVDAIGRIDVLLVPVGGNYTVDAQEATKIVEDVNPRLVIPMHFKTDSLDFPIGKVEAFTDRKKNVRILRSPSVEITHDRLPDTTEVWVLSHLL